MAIELHHLHPGHDDELTRLKARIAELEKLNHDLCECVTENDEIRLHLEEIEQTRVENERLKEMMPKYDRLIEEEKFKKKLVDEYDGYVYEWMGHSYIATPYINVFIKGILRALWLARAARARSMKTYEALDNYTRNHLNRNSRWDYISSQRYDCWFYVWDKCEQKFLKKAEEYK